MVGNQPEHAALAIEHDAPRLGLTPIARASQPRPPRDMLFNFNLYVGKINPTGGEVWKLRLAEEVRIPLVAK